MFLPATNFILKDAIKIIKLLQRKWTIAEISFLQ